MRTILMIFGLIFIVSCQKKDEKQTLNSKNKKDPPFPTNQIALKNNKKEFIALLNSYNLDIVKNVQPLNDSLKKYDLDYLLMSKDKDVEKSIKLLFLNNYENNIKNYHQGYDLLNQPPEFSKLVKKLMSIYQINPNVEFLNSGFLVEKERNSLDKEIKSKINQILKEEKKVSASFK